MKKNISPAFWLYTFTFCFTATAFFYCYSPGLSSPFLLDDYANLSKLGDFNGIRNLDTFARFIFSGLAGPTGRPISLLSFLVDSNNWPTNATPFKRSNIFLHFCTGFLLFLFIRNIFLTQLTDPRTVFYAALIATAIWLFHPFLVSTVLYAIQRMTLLATLFVLLGLYLYSYGRLLLDRNPHKAYRYMTFAVCVCSSLAVLSKENGALLPLLILVVEKIIFSNAKTKLADVNKYWFNLFITLPSLVIIAYLLNIFYQYGISPDYAGRAFTLEQRLLTESRVVSEYLYNLFIPQMYYSGIFNENYPLSTSLFNPLTTLAAFIFIIFSVVTAFIIRTKLPLVSAAVIFFFAGHLIESTVIPLEIYFEHRNYLPSVLLFLPIGQCFIHSNSTSLKLVFILFLGICILFTYQRTVLWGKPNELTLFWALQNPNSQRAQRTAAITLDQNGKTSEALKVLVNAKQKLPNSLAIKLHWLVLQCKSTTKISEAEFNTINDQFLATPYEANLTKLINAVLAIASEEKCTGLDHNKALLMLENLMLNPVIKNSTVHTYQMHHFKGRIYAQHGRGQEAAQEFSNSLNLSKKIDHGLLQTTILASNTHYQEALEHLDKTESIFLKQKKDFRFYLNQYDLDINHLKELLSEDLQKNQESINGNHG